MHFNDLKQVWHAAFKKRVIFLFLVFFFGMSSVIWIFGQGELEFNIRMIMITLGPLLAGAGLSYLSIDYAWDMLSEHALKKMIAEEARRLSREILEFDSYG